MDAAKVVEAYVGLKREVSELEAKLDRTKKEFYLACDELSEGKDSFQFEDVSITKATTAGKWEYSPEIQVLETKLKSSKKQFQILNESIGGKERIWKIGL